MPKSNQPDRSNFHAYRRKLTGRQRLRNALVALLLVAAMAACGAGGFVLGRYTDILPALSPASTPEYAAPVQSQSQSDETALGVPPAAPPMATAEPVQQPLPSTAEEAAAGVYLPQRLLAPADSAAWDTSVQVTPTLDQSYQNTDYRMVALPMQGTVTDDYFSTVTFVGDSLTSGLGIYDTGFPNAHYAAYMGAGPDVIVNNSTVTNLITNATETPIETIVASQPDYVYILFGTNTLVSPNNEDRLLAYYERMIDVLRQNLDPGVIFYIQAIPGVQEDVVLTKPGLDNNRIINVNNQLANLALRKGCYFVNIREALTKADGSMIDEYDAQYDGVHFNPAGYQAWHQYLTTHTAWNRRSIYIGKNPYYIFGT